MILSNVEVPNPPSVYFTEAYGRTVAEEMNAEWMVCSANDGMWQLPLIVSRIDESLSDATSPYGYAGIQIDSSLSSATINHLWGETVSLLKEKNFVSVFLRFSPFLRQPYEEIGQFDGLQLIHMSNTVGIRVVDCESMWCAMRGRARTAVRKAKSVGMVGEIQIADESLASSLHPFRQLYSDTMSRLQAGSQYLFSNLYFENLVRGLGDRLLVVSVKDLAGKVVASCLVFADQLVAHYHLSASQPESARQGANNLMIWTLMEWASENNMELIHLGGGMRENDSLFAFKASFGNLYYPYYVGRLIVDETNYTRLTRVHTETYGVTVDSLKKDFFPLYRADMEPTHSSFGTGPIKKALVSNGKKVDLDQS